MQQIHLTGKHSNGQSVIVDDDMFDFLNKWKWWLNPHGYAVRGGWKDGRSVLYRLHRVVIGADPGQIVDHVNQNRLDCRRDNLRLCTTSQNNANSRRRGKPVKGTYYDPRSNLSRPWATKVSVAGRMVHFGYFATQEEASYVYDQVIIQLHGAFAQLNGEHRTAV